MKNKNFYAPAFSCVRNFFYILFASLIFFSCALPQYFSQEETYDINLPQWPPKTDALGRFSYPALSKWLVTIQTQSEQKKFYTTEKTVSLSVKKNEIFAITAQPVTKNKNDETLFFMPAGIILPTSDNNTLSWEEGFLADIFCRTAQLNFPVENFNWKKAQESITKKLSAQSTVFYNPWLCSKEKIIGKIIKGSFKESYLNPSSVINLDFSEEKILPIAEKFQIISSFIPENKNIEKEKCVSVQKNEKSVFLLSKNHSSTQDFYAEKNFDFGVIIEWKSKKNISAETIYMPIYFEEL